MTPRPAEQVPNGTHTGTYGPYPGGPDPADPDKARIAQRQGFGMPDSGSSAPAVLDMDGLQALVDELHQRGYTVLGPTVRDGAIRSDELNSVSDLAIGWGDEQDAAHYRLRRRDDDAAFGYAVGPDSPKKVLFPPRRKLWQAERDAMIVTEEPVREQFTAFLGVRACELAAIAVQDRVFLGGAVTDPAYASGRRTAFLVAVTCSDPAGTCFCASMDAGPAPRHGFDLALTELLEGGHRFVVEVGSAAGAYLLGAVPRLPATAADVFAAAEVASAAARRMGRQMPTSGLRDLLYDNVDHARWDDVADRCLSCGNCTMACPTCFCATVDDVTDLSGRSTQRWWVWDSCFTATHSYIHGGSVRLSTLSRYRQWMTHKLAAWEDQFGMSGCVGCGRCITWCPAGIDITEEVAAIAASPRHAPARPADEERT